MGSEKQALLKLQSYPISPYNITCLYSETPTYVVSVGTMLAINLLGKK